MEGGMMNFSRTSVKAVLMCMVAALALFMMSSVAAEEETIGSDEYRISCLSCHGVGGRGDGPLARFLTVPPSDLTILAKSNGGQYPELKPGAFPFLRVFQVIDGRAIVEAHGDRAMPVWGNRYLVDQPIGPHEGACAGMYETVVRGRILELVYYIQSIQQ
jgi:mono/diheme cytochrome c family protein